MKNFSTNPQSLLVGVLMLSALMFGSGCTQDDVEPTIGATGTSKALYVSSEAGSRTIRVSSNSPWQVRLTAETRDWVAFDGPDAGDGIGSFTVTYRTNDGFPRKGTLLVESGSRQVIDTVYLMQYGTTPLLQFTNHELAYASVSSSSECPIDTNIPEPLFEKIDCEVIYPSDGPGDWIRIDTIAEALHFVVEDNLAFTPRTAQIRLGFTDDWGAEYTTTCSIQQGIPGGTPDTREVTFEELRALISASEGELLIEDDIAVSGTVISDCTSPNMAALPMPAPKTRPDVSASGPNYRTAYIQNADATLGLMLLTTTAEQNNMHRYEKVKLWCKGLTLTKKSNPERYELSGVTQEHFVTKVAGTAEELPQKRRFIDELTDNDLYTFVTLKRCMMALRTGRFAPVHGNYFANPNPASTFIAYYPNVVIDRHGSTIHLMTNTGCSYRYDELPDGEGTISGILVHESYTFFDKDGDIGRYQIRNLTREEIALEESDEDAFSAVAVEWAPNGSNSGTGNAREYAYPQYPHPATSDGRAHCMAASTGSGLSFISTYAWLAWGTSYRAEPSGSSVGSTGWGHAQLWNTAANTGHAILFEFSTQGITSDQCAFAFACRYNAGQGCLRYWTAEYSVDGDEWKTLGDFTIPDPGNWSNMQPEQLSGDKYICMNVPAEILGRSVAWIRLRPVSNKIGTATGYDSGTIASNGTMGAPVLISYAVLRYNK